jgi:hypothetical protein
VPCSRTVARVPHLRNAFDFFKTAKIKIEGINFKGTAHAVLFYFVTSGGAGMCLTAENRELPQNEQIRSKAFKIRKKLASLD